MDAGLVRPRVGGYTGNHLSCGLLRRLRPGNADRHLTVSRVCEDGLSRSPRILTQAMTLKVNAPKRDLVSPSADQYSVQRGHHGVKESDEVSTRETRRAIVGYLSFSYAHWVSADIVMHPRPVVK